jgi:hypothetical protein
MTNHRNFFIVIIIALSLYVLVQAQNSGTPSQLRILTDANNSLILSSTTQVSPISQPTVFSNARLRTDANNNLMVIASFTDNIVVNGDLVYSIATPTITSGFSTSAPSIVGKASSFAVTIGATPSITGTIAFNTTWSNIPSVICTNTITANAVQAVPTLTTVVLNGVWVQSDVIRCIAIGY